MKLQHAITVLFALASTPAFGAAVGSRQVNPRQINGLAATGGGQDVDWPNGDSLASNSQASDSQASDSQAGASQSDSTPDSTTQGLPATVANGIGPAGTAAAPGQGTAPVIAQAATTAAFPTTAGPLPNPSGGEIVGQALTNIPNAPPAPAPTQSMMAAPADIVASAGADAEQVAASLASSADAVLATGGVPGLVGSGPQAADPIGGSSSQYLYVWAGADDRIQSDRIITFDFNPNSPNYGRALSQTLVTSGNEPHHCGISTNGRTMVCGGFLSQFRGQPELFVFDVATDPANPRFISNNRGGFGNVPDEIFPLSDGSIFVTEMCNNWGGGAPGRLARLDGNGTVIAEYPRNPDQQFLPHGIDVRADLNLLVTSDFLNLASALNVNNPNGDPITQSAVRVWNLATMDLSPYKINLPSGTASMELRLLKRDPRGRGFVGGTGSGKVYLFDPFTRTAKEVINVNNVLTWIQKAFSPKVTAQMKQVSDDDRFLYLLYASDFDKWTKRSGFYSGVLVFDITNPEYPRTIQDFKLPAYAGPHLIKIYGNRLAITDYFLNLDNFGKIHSDGDRFVRVFTIGQDGRISLDPRFQIPFTNLIPGVRLRPHGLALKLA